MIPMTQLQLSVILNPLEQFDLIKLLPFLNFGLRNLTLILLQNVTDIMFSPEGEASVCASDNFVQFSFSC